LEKHTNLSFSAELRVLLWTLQTSVNHNRDPCD
jgi:hypothetical protein